MNILISYGVLHFACAYIVLCLTLNQPDIYRGVEFSDGATIKGGSLFLFIIALGPVVLASTLHAKLMEYFK